MPLPIRISTPNKSSLKSSVVLVINNDGGDNIFYTKKDVDDMIEALIEERVDKWFSNTFFAMEAELKQKIEMKMKDLEEYTKNYLNQCYTKSVNTMVDGMMNYRFEEEVKNRVNKELQKRGKF